MKNKNVALNVVAVFIGILIILFISNLTKQYIYLMNSTYVTKYTYIIMSILCLGYCIFGLWLGVNDIYRQYKSKGKWKFSNGSFILIFTFVLIIITSFCIKFNFTILNSLILVLFVLYGYIISQSIKRIQ